MRIDNERLSGMIEEKDYEIGRLNGKIKKIDLRYNLYGKKPVLKKKANDSQSSLSR